MPRADWRLEAMKLKIRIANGEDIAQTARQARQLQAKRSGVTVGEIIDKRIEWISALVATNAASPLTIRTCLRVSRWS